MKPGDTTLPSPEALDFAGFVMMHCGLIADENRAGELICPFAVIWGENGRRVENFESETQAEAVERGWASLAASRERSEWWAFGREGLYRTEHGPEDVLVVTVWTPELDEPFTVMQPFARATDESLRVIGSPQLFTGGRHEPERVDEWDASSFYRGMESHPRSARLASWRQLH